MDESTLSIAQAVLTALWKPAKACWRRTRIWLFRWRTRKPPFPGVKANEVAYSVLAGDIVSATSFCNIDPPHVLIACLRKTSESDHDPRVYVLERIGQTFRARWKSEPLCATLPVNLEVQDIDRDGNCEVVFEDHSYGTGGGSRSLMVYSVPDSRLLSVTESLNWQDRAGPASPGIGIRPSDEPEILKALENVGKKRGFLKANQPIDLDSPEFSVQRWHKENGTRTSGTIKIHYYQGVPALFSQASVVTMLETSSETSLIRWISFFKGPLVAYDVLNDRHFIAFSPAWSYNWITSMAWDGRTLWFGTHSGDGLMSFTPRESELESYDSFEGTALPRAGSLDFEAGALTVNGTLRVPVDALARQNLSRRRGVDEKAAYMFGKGPGARQT